MEWYTFEPADTLFFKGAGPMNLGENHTATLNFPPPAHTITGALRSTLLARHGISIKQYYGGDVDADLMAVIGPADGKAGFEVIGPLFQVGETIYVPAPFSWFTDKEEVRNPICPVYRGYALESHIFITSGNGIIWARGKTGELQSLGGRWISVGELRSQSEAMSIKETDDFYQVEAQIGIALEPNRSVRPGHLYSFQHARVKLGVKMVFGVDRPIPLSRKGVLRLGAEKRFGVYEKATGIHHESGKSGYYMSLSVIEGNESANEAAVCTGKIQYLGGWDMKRGFHKPMKGYFPAGTVFNKKINQNFLEL